MALTRQNIIVILKDGTSLAFKNANIFRDADLWIIKDITGNEIGNVKVSEFVCWFNSDKGGDSEAI